MDELLIPEGTGITLPETDGYGQMITGQGRFLYWDPNEKNNAADAMWRTHTEEQLRIRIAEKLVTKREEAA